MPAEEMPPLGKVQAHSVAGSLSFEENSRLIGPSSIVAFSGITFTILADQILLSRLFGGTMTYYYGFMLISLAMLGLAAGGLVVHLAQGKFNIEKFATQTSLLSLAMGVATFVGTLCFLWVYPHLNM